ncbi:hypothetical protein W97_06815 [Coniosporium apollinis CBS 100218]|uniref:Outer spore wall protein RRT8 n=1 Tax=Coniosporium apollinis (strain CBS 100218) TaxID=1168221 RepID=R7Z0J6_CONA1|nr:uncharacterized protein W97_06815 [Coniosporium apollinis CBS 100218]EON67672.1 hypothetical protein W97_06815 [Coniosporium apollinis CBS 100218]
MSEQIKETAKEEVERVKALTKDAVRSGAYIYPFKGIAYFLSHRSIQKPLFNKLAPTITTGIGVTTFMFLFTYIPQLAVLAIFNGPIAVISTVLLVLSESSTIANLLSRGFFLEDALIDTFDGTLVSRGMTEMVSEGRHIKPGSDPMAKLGKLMKKPFARFTPQALVRYLMYLPLNFIPVIGTVLFVLLQGRKHGPSAHARYFQLKGMSGPQREKFVEERQAAYTSFGVPAVLLELVPIAGIFFAFTNAVGAALWAADLEQHGSTAPGLREQARKAE